MAEVGGEVRFYLDSVEAAVRAVLFLVMEARNGTEDFEFGPTDLPALMDSGLLVQGASDRLLTRIAALPGLSQEEPDG